MATNGLAIAMLAYLAGDPARLVEVAASSAGLVLLLALGIPRFVNSLRDPTLATQVATVLSLLLVGVVVAATSGRHCTHFGRHSAGKSSQGSGKSTWPLIGPL